MGQTAVSVATRSFRLDPGKPHCLTASRSEQGTVTNERLGETGEHRALSSEHRSIDTGVGNIASHRPGLANPRSFDPHLRSSAYMQ